ncbi:type II toxin-antitoxin system Phd/YefM family antitoxin [Arenimonas sp.]|uniref:type II toxin-antitoxin system Phd/YefM family antitoxin n=1 Tax=Arenimonas sp. TaxID=1872635 RepID=UPI0039E645B5
MSTLSFRNRSGETVAMPSYAATDAKNSFGKLMQAAARKGAVAITRHNAPEAVLLSIEQYQALVDAGSQKLDDLSQEFDSLLAQMQTPKTRRGARTAFNAAPSALGKAAVSQARKRG